MVKHRMARRYLVEIVMGTVDVLERRSLTAKVADLGGETRRS